MKEENKDLRFHITITDNETGETLYDSGANVIIGAYGDGEETCALTRTHCSLNDMAVAVIAAETAVANLKAAREELGPITELIKLYRGSTKEN